MLRDTWDSGELKIQTVVDWVEHLKERLEAVHELVDIRETEAKSRMKRSYDKNAKLRSVEEGDLFLLRMPDLHGKHDDNGKAPMKF